MHIWGSFALHPLTFPVADQLAALIGGSSQYLLAMCGATLKPMIEDFQFLFDHL